MVALFGDAHDASIFTLSSVTTSAPTPTARGAAGGDLLAAAPAGRSCSDGLARLSDILPQVLERYGLDGRAEANRQETKRPDVARGRRRVG